MERFHSLHGVAAPIIRANIDTDAIAPTNVPPAVDMTFTNFAARLFGVLRYHPDGREKAGFVLNRPSFSGAQILIAGRNFGCGSSRENAVWALASFGIRCIFAPSFGGIFADNAFQNGLLLGQISEGVVENLGSYLKAAEAAGGDVRLLVNLTDQSVGVPGGAIYRFEIPEVRRQALLDGISQIDLLKQFRPHLSRFEEEAAVVSPWLLLGRPH